MAPLSKAQVNKLGDKLRSGAPVGEPDLGLLQQFRAAYQEPLASAQRLLQERLGLDAASRIKTVNTIVEKRDALAARIKTLFESARLLDRRADPTYGYRAVHLVVAVRGYPVEIQVRTKLQDTWAQTMERLADLVGRGIRYGEMPAEKSRAHLVELMMQASRQIGRLEETMVVLDEHAREHEDTETRLQVWKGEIDAGADTRRDEYHRLREAADAVRHGLDENRIAVKALIEDIVEILGAISNLAEAAR